LEKDFGSSKSVFGFRVLLGNPKSEIQNRKPDFPIERTLKTMNTENVPGMCVLTNHMRDLVTAENEWILSHEIELFLDLHICFERRQGLIFTFILQKLKVLFLSI